jgi:energy-coupling factor transporter ATP-binding protein EcfA2
MRIQGKQTYLSIKPFPPTDTPSFVVVVGPNGSGKTQLLQAIASGRVSTNRTPDVPPVPMPVPGVVLLTNFTDEMGLLQPLQQNASSSYFTQPPPAGVPQSRHMYSPETIQWRWRDVLLAEARRSLADITQGRSEEVFQAGHDPWGEGSEALADLLGYAKDSKDREQLADVFRRAESRLTQPNMPSDVPAPEDLRSNPMQYGIFAGKVAAAAQALKVSPLVVNQQQATDVGSWGGYSPYSPNVNQLMAAYRDAQLRNDLQLGQDRRDGTELALTPLQFTAAFGAPPWEQISAVLQSFGLDYEVAAPSMRPIDPVSFSLKKPDEPVYVTFASLSSGEKVLVQLALSLFTSDPLRTSIDSLPFSCWTRKTLLFTLRFCTAGSPLYKKRWWVIKG